MKRTVMINRMIRAGFLFLLVVRPGTCPDGPLDRARARSVAVLERRTCQEGDRRVREGDHGKRRREVRGAGGAHRRVRSGRHDLGGAADVYAGGLLPGARPGGGEGEAGTRKRRAVQDRAVRQPRGDGQVHDGGSHEDSRCHPHRHDGGRVQQPKRRSGSRPPSIRASSSSIRT